MQIATFQIVAKNAIAEPVLLAIHTLGAVKFLDLFVSQILAVPVLSVLLAQTVTVHVYVRRE